MLCNKLDSWLANNSVEAVYKKDILAGVFYTIYGINDWTFFIFFTLVMFQLFRLNNIDTI